MESRGGVPSCIFPHEGLIGGGQWSFPPGGGRLGQAKEVLPSPPPEPSSIQGEGSCSQVTRLKYLPLSAPWRGKVGIGGWEEGEEYCTGEGLASIKTSCGSFGHRSLFA
jgi:hypothetical protein